MTNVLAVIGAGPKGLAIAAKAQVLAECGATVPEVILIDQAGVAANWRGEHGFTDGRRTLGTGPEKDVGFPYASKPWGSLNAAVDRAMLRFSWQSYLVERQEFALWIDQGRPQPVHADWAEYLQWVASRLRVVVQRARVVAIELAGGTWRLGTEPNSMAVVADALVVTGPGSASPPIPISGTAARVWNGQDFWTHYGQLDDFLPPGERVAVIGSGETAAVILVAIAEARPDVPIEVVTRRGISYSRGESFEENRVYTDPESIYVSWEDMSEAHRREFTDRTDRGVFSLTAKAVLDRSRLITTFPGEVTSITGEDTAAQLSYKPSGSGRSASSRSEVVERYALVVVATAFNPEWFRELFGAQATAALSRALGQSKLDERIGRDLSVEGLVPQLHLPMLAGFRQGPGFPNLSSLGLLSDRVLQPYVGLPPAET